MDADDGSDWFWRDGTSRRITADAFGRRKSMVIITTLIILSRCSPLTRCSVLATRFWFLPPAAGVKSDGADLRADGRAVTELFPTEVRYTGASFSYNVA